MGMLLTTRPLTAPMGRVTTMPSGSSPLAVCQQGTLTEAGGDRLREVAKPVRWREHSRSGVVEYVLQLQSQQQQHHLHMTSLRLSPLKQGVCTSWSMTCKQCFQRCDDEHSRHNSTSQSTARTLSSLTCSTLHELHTSQQATKSAMSQQLPLFRAAVTDERQSHKKKQHDAQQVQARGRLQARTVHARLVHGAVLMNRVAMQHAVPCSEVCQQGR